MASVLHGSARTTPHLGAEFQASKESSRALAARYGLNASTSVFLLDLSYFPPAHGRPRGEEQGARRKPCRAAFIVAPRLRRPCAPAWDHADSNRRRSARTPSRLARPTCALIAMALDIVSVSHAS